MMLRLLVISLLVFGSILQTYAQVSIQTDGSNPDPSAMLDVKSTTKGILIPRMTFAQEQAIVSPAQGLMVFNTTS